MGRRQVVLLNSFRSRLPVISDLHGAELLCQRPAPKFQGSYPRPPRSRVYEYEYVFIKRISRNSFVGINTGVI